MASQLQLTGIPTDVLVNIFSFLHPQDLGACNQTCNGWHQKLQEREFLEKVIRRSLPSFPFEQSKSLQKDYSIQYNIHYNTERGIHELSLIDGHHAGQVNSLLFAGEELFSVALDYYEKVKVWDLKPKTCKETFSPHSTLGRSVAVIDGLVFLGSPGGSIKIYDRVSKQWLKPLEGHTDCVEALATAERDKKKVLISGSADKKIMIWDVGSMECIKTLEGHSERVKAFAVVGNKFFSGSWDKTIIAWDLNSFERLGLLKCEGAVNSLVANKKHLFSALADKSIVVWELDSLQQAAVMTGHTGAVACLSIDGDILFSGSTDHTIRIWNFHNFNCSATLHDEQNFFTTLAAKNGRLYSDSSVNGKILVRDFTVSHRTLLKTVAAALKQIGDHKKTLEMLDRFPQSVKNKICSDEKAWNEATDLQKAEMIENYL